MSATTWSSPAYEGIALLLRTRTGLHFPPNRLGNTEAGIRRAMARAGLSDSAVYLRLLEEERVAEDDLINELTVGETYFFREPAQFDFIRNVILPELQHLNPPEHTLRAWSAGCASGEEAYSLAILMREESRLQNAEILATDISRAALAKAHRGLYRSWSLRGLPRAVIDRYFRARDDLWELDGLIRGRVRFEHLNLSRPVYPSLFTGIRGMDLILCRNVLIYFDLSTAHDVGERLLASLGENGWLITGPSDPPLGNLDSCEMVVTPAGVFYRRKGGSARRAPGPAFPARLVEARPPGATAFPGPPEALALPEPMLAMEAPVAPAIAMPAPMVSEGSLGGLANGAMTRPAFVDPRPDALDLAASAMEQGDYRRVLQLVGALPEGIAASALGVQALANLNRLEAARGAAREAVERHPLSTELHYLRATLLLDGGELAEAAQAVRRVLFLDRSLIVAHFTLGTILRRLGDGAGAARAYRNALLLCGRLPPEAPLPLAEGERAGWLAEAAQAQLAMLEEAP